MKIRKVVGKPLIVLLTVSQCMTLLPGHGKLYYLDESGQLAEGWHLISGIWCFFTRSMMAHTVQLSKMAGTGLTDTVTITPT